MGKHLLTGTVTAEWRLREVVIIGSLMAQGLSAEQAAPLGVYVHAAAADERSKTVSMHGLTAGEIINGLSDVLS